MTHATVAIIDNPIETTLTLQILGAVLAEGTLIAYLNGMPFGTERTALPGLVCHQTRRYGASEDPSSVSIHDVLDHA